MEVEGDGGASDSFAPRSEGNGRRAVDDRVEEALRVLETAVSRAVPVNELAAMVGLSSSRFQHLFKEQLGVSVREYIRLLRLEAAAKLVISTRQRISEICYAVGFTDPSNFNHAFKRRFGTSPGQFRRQAGASPRGELGERPRNERPEDCER